MTAINFRSHERIERTTKLLQNYIEPRDAIVYSMGHPNPFDSEVSKRAGITYRYWEGLDLNDDYEQLASTQLDYVVSTEVLEHVFSPYGIMKTLRQTPAKLAIVTVPLRVWFSQAYWTDDYYDRHYHEFEQRQFLWMCEQAGWSIVETQQWKYSRPYFGVRPFLRYLWPSWLAVVLRPADTSN